MFERADGDQLNPNKKSCESSMAYPNLKQAIWLLALLILTEMGFGMLIYAAGIISSQPLEHNNYLLGITKLAVYLLVLLYISRRADRRWASLLYPGNASSDWRLWASVALSISGTALVLFELNKAVISVIPMPELFQELIKSTVGRETSYPSALFHAAIVAPYVEELLFRGVILCGLLSNHSRKCAIIWSSILFGLSHLNPWQFSPALLYGFVFAWWTISTGSLWPAVVGHALNNLLSTTFMRIDVPYFAVSEDLNDVVFNPWWWTASGIALAALGLWWFHQISNKNRSANSNTIETGDTPEVGD
ncbi:MAG: CPBP family intramembrane metalloprotease [Gemmatimonadota bacterium]|nr:CPBP family intramembrane metalloprotease [Gemmatimonadota bacterium]